MSLLIERPRPSGMIVSSSTMAFLLDLALQFLAFLSSDRCQYVLCSQHVASCRPDFDDRGRACNSQHCLSSSISRSMTRHLHLQLKRDSKIQFFRPPQVVHSGEMVCTAIASPPVNCPAVSIGCCTTHRTDLNVPVLINNRCQYHHTLNARLPHTKGG